MATPPVALIVDDSPEMRLVMTSLFKNMGITVKTASDGEKGLELARASRPDLICLDLMLPALCGLDVCEMLKQSPETADIPVLIVSARPYPQDRVDASNVGAAGYITKPINREEFVQQVRSVLASRQVAEGA